jgi:hypothetical protein
MKAWKAAVFMEISSQRSIAYVLNTTSIYTGLEVK